MAVRSNLFGGCLCLSLFAARIELQMMILTGFSVAGIIKIILWYMTSKYEEWVGAHGCMDAMRMSMVHHFMVMTGLSTLECRYRSSNREVADFHTAGIFIWDTSYFHCDSLNYESQFIE